MSIKRRKEASQRREIIVTLRLTEGEGKALETAVQESGLSQSDILRTALRGVLKGLARGFKKFLDDVQEDTANRLQRQVLTSRNGNGHK